jgi:sporulation-control protein spo0M
MGLFDGDATIELAVDRETVLPGDAIRVTATVDGEPDEKVRGGRIELLYRNRYRFTERDRRNRNRTRTRFEDVVVADHHFGRDEASQAIELAIPADAPATATNIVQWKVRAVLDRRRAIDADAERALTVLAPRENGPAPAPEEPAGDGDRWMDVQVPIRVVAPGQTIGGTFIVTPREELKVKELRVELVFRRLDDPEGKTGCIDTRTIAEVNVAPKGVLAPGVAVAHPFSLPIPADLPPTFRAKHNELRWFVRGVVSLPILVDPERDVEIHLFNAP